MQEPIMIKLFPISRRAKDVVKLTGNVIELVGASELAITVQHPETGYYGWLFLGTDILYERI